MIKSHKEIKTKEVEIIDDIICNCCGKPIRHGEEIHKEYPDNIYVEYIPVKTSFGYFTEEFLDGESHEFEVCEQCYSNWLKTFKYAPKGFGRTEDFYKDEDCVNFEDWKDDNNRNS